MEEILSDLQLLEEADQLCIIAARSLASNTWLTKQIDEGTFSLDNYRLYNARMGNARLEPQEKCSALDAGLQKLSKRSKDMLDDGSTVHEVYLHLQTELYRRVWRYHLCLCEEPVQPYFDRLDDNKEAHRHLYTEEKQLPHPSPSSYKKTTTKALTADLRAVDKLKNFSVSLHGFAMHDASKPFASSHGQLIHAMKNIFGSFDAFLVSRAFSVPMEVCEEFGKNLTGMRRHHHLLLADIVQELSPEAAVALKKMSFAEVEDAWHAEIERRNVELLLTVSVV